MLGVVGLAGADGFQVPGGYPTPYFTGGNLCVLQHQGTGGNDGALTDLAVVEQGAAHADECAVVDFIASSRAMPGALIQSTRAKPASSNA